MFLLRPLDFRASNAMRACGVHWLNYHWTRVSPAALALALLEQHGVAEAVARECAHRMSVNYSMWLDHLAHEAELARRSLPIRTLVRLASKLARHCTDTYVGTEHLFLACLESDTALLDGTARQLASHFVTIWKTFWSEPHLDSTSPRIGRLRWPKWAPRHFLRTEDFPKHMADDAPLIVECIKLYSKRQLLAEPAIRFALEREPHDVAQLRQYVVDFFCRDSFD